jgi:outer membrane protein assembly factor BamB
MKRSQFMGASPAGRGLRVLVRSAMLSVLLAVTTAAFAPAAAGAAASAGQDGAPSVFYTTSGAGFGFPNGAEIFAITVRGATVTTRDVGPTGAAAGDCGSLALSPGGTLYSMCGPTFGTQRLATINQQTGHAHLFGVPVPGLAVMALAFRGGTLYAVGDCNPDPVTFECIADSDFNALYKVNMHTGAFTRIGPTTAPEFFMDLTIDRHGNMLGETSTVNISATPARLYRIDPATGIATKLFDLTGSTSVMGLAFGRDGKLYATDNPQNPHLYLINTTTGVETAIAALPFAYSSGLELMNPRG